MEKFDSILKQMPNYKAGLTEITLNDATTLSKKAGVYVFYKEAEAWYVGKTDNLGRRLKQHSDIGSKHNQATFAFKLAKDKWTENNKIDKKFTRQALEAMDSFMPHFKDAKGDVAQMKIKFVEIENAHHQYLFEYWLAIELEAKYNQFENH